MKTNLCIGILLLAAVFAHAQTNSLTGLLQQGLFEEQANRNLDAAIADYQTLAAQFDKDRQLAATAVFRLGECYRAQGRTNEAASQYQRIVREFSDQQMLVTLSRQDLAGMGIAASQETAADATASNALRQQKMDAVQQEILAVTQRLDDIQKRVQVGVAVQTQADELKDQLARLQAELARLQSPLANMPNPAPPAGSEEDQEILRVQQMIQNSPDLINATTSEGTPLFKAATHGWLKVAAYLLDHGADVNARGIFRNTPLLAAVESGNKAMTQFLIDHGANLNDQNDEGQTALHLAARKGFQAVTEVLLASHADVNAMNNNSTPLFEAVAAGHLKIVQMILAAGADVNLKNGYGWTALNDAVQKSPDIVQPLLAAGINPNTTDQSGRTPLSYAVEKQDNLPMVTSLLAAGANPNTTDQSGRTPLSYAAEKQNNLPTVKSLLAARADPDGGTMNPPLLCAIHMGDTNTAELLLQAGANPNKKTAVNYYHNDSGVTPLYLAVSTGQLPMVQLLLKFKADPNDSQTDGQAVMFLALDKPAIARALLEAGASPDEKSSRELGRPRFGGGPVVYETLLQTAAYQNQAETVELLLEHGADPNARGTDGNSALDYAARALADDKVFTSLLDHKADPNVRNNDGVTPLDIIKREAEDSKSWPVRFSSYDAKAAHAKALIVLLHRHGALDNPPDWDAITVIRPSANFSQCIFRKGTNDWNHFTLLETILNFYGTSSYQMGPSLSFPELTRVVIVRPSHGSPYETRMTVNLLNSTNGIDLTKDRPLEFGDVVEIPERDHALSENPIGLTDYQTATLAEYVKGGVKLVAHGQQVELPIQRVGYLATLDTVLRNQAAWEVLLASSDLSRVKVVRHDPKTGEQHEWTFDCSNLAADNSSGFGVNVYGGTPLSYQWYTTSNGNNVPSGNMLWLCNGDVIEVPEKP